MNNLISQITGVKEDVPVPCAVMPRTNYRDRLERMRKRRDPDGIEDDNESQVSRVLGEADQEQDAPSEGIIPDEAEDLDIDTNSTAKLRPVKDVVQEPSSPTGEKEKYLTPYSALTAPDVTPQALEPIDPSRVPGKPAGQPFRAADAASAPEPEPHGGINAMDVLLGRDRAGASTTPEVNPAREISTAEAQRMLNISPTGEPVSGKAALQEGQPMPEHQVSDGSKVLQAYRRFAG